MPKKLDLVYDATEKDSGYYHLVPPKLTFWGQIKLFLGRIILFPYHVYQIIIGRLVTYFIINPLFRKDERRKSDIKQHPKYPDPAFEDSDEITIYQKVR